MRSVVRAVAVLSAALLAVPGLLLVTPSAPAQAAAAAPLAISITGMTPQEYATSGSTVTVTGTLANHTGSAVSGIDVQAETSSEYFSSRSAMTSFTSTGAGASLGLVDTSETGAVPNGKTVRWSVSFPAGEFYSSFGVYPVEVRAVTADGAHSAEAHTSLVYWTDSGPVTKATRLQTSWVWPLAYAPQQGACGQTLATSGLAGAVSPGGQLSTLLDAGAEYSQSDNLTWEIDPALLSDVSVMEKKYFTQGSADCSGRFSHPASPAASSWLGKLADDTAADPAFLTSYANVDAAALSHAGLDANLQSAYQLGEKVAGQVLPRTFGSHGPGTGAANVLLAARPAGGQADAGVLTSLAHYGGIQTVLLGTGELHSPTTNWDDAIAGRTTSGVGTSMNILLADSEITGLLSSASAQATESGQFTLTHDFLAETAMIEAEAPSQQRSLVIAPPTDWDPSATEATALLKVTQHAPWLKSTTLSALATQSSKVQAPHVQAMQVSKDELSASYLAGVKKADSSLALFTNLIYQPNSGTVSSLQAALAATESSSWRDRGSAGGWLAMSRLSTYLEDAGDKVEIVSSKKILLAGESGETPVSVRNELGEAVQVRVEASSPSGSGLTVGSQSTLLKVAAEGTNTVRISVHSTAIGTTTLQLELVTQNGSPLSWTTKSLSVEVTRVGRFLLGIVGGALAILVLTSAYRLRRKRLARARQRDRASAGGAG